MIGLPSRMLVDQVLVLLFVGTDVVLAVTPGFTVVHLNPVIAIASPGGAHEFFADNVLAAVDLRDID